MYYTDDPVRDFERYDRDQWRRQERMCKGKCAHCGEDVYEYEEHYDLDGDLVHSDCLMGWADNYKVEV